MITHSFEPKMKIAIAFTWTLIFYVFIGPVVGLLATILLFEGIQLSQFAWAYIELYWLHTTHCGPFDGGDCLYLNPRTTFLPQYAQLFSASGVKGLTRLLFWVYVFGFIPALFAGLLVASGTLIGDRNFRWWHALALGFVVAIVVLVPISENRFHGATFAKGAAWFVFVCTTATTLCALPVRFWWPRASSHINPTPKGELLETGC